MGIKLVDGEGLDVALSSVRRPLLVYFEAEGCAACDLGRTRLEQALAACDGRLEVLRCDVWDAPSAVAGLGLLSLPTAVLFVHGEEVMRLAGVPRRRRLATLVEAGLRAANAFEAAAAPVCALILHGVRTSIGSSEWPFDPQQIAFYVHRRCAGSSS